MAIVSESMLYQERIAPSYVSSSGYYGYVPPTCPFANYESVVVKQPCNNSANEAIDETTIIGGIAAAAAATTGNNHWTISDSALIFQRQNNDEVARKYCSAMETDEDETMRNDESRVGVSRCQNNRCVIPEAGVRNANVGSSLSSSLHNGGGRYETFCRVFEGPEVNDVTKRRGNRKRSCAGDPAYLIDDRSANFTKKFRQETVVTATLAMVHDIHESSDRPRCIMSRHH